MFSRSNRSSKRVGRVFVGIVLALLSIGIFAGLEAWGAAGTGDVGRALSGPLTTVTAVDSGRAAGQPLGVDAVSSLGHQAVRVLTTMITAVFDGWWQPIDVALDWMDDIRRGWTAIHRFPGTAAPRS
jgi:hypothetical protein